MLFDKFEVKQYEEKFYEDLKLSYKESFKMDLLTKNEYRNRFKLNNEYSSFLLINRENQIIVGHIGFKLNNLNLDIKGKLHLDLVLLYHQIIEELAYINTLWISLRNC